MSIFCHFSLFNLDVFSCNHFNGANCASIGHFPDAVSPEDRRCARWDLVFTYSAIHVLRLLLNTKTKSKPSFAIRFTPSSRCHFVKMLLRWLCQFHAKRDGGQFRQTRFLSGSNAISLDPILTFSNCFSSVCSYKSMPVSDVHRVALHQDRISSTDDPAKHFLSSSPQCRSMLIVTARVNPRLQTSDRMFEACPPLELNPFDTLL